jgi:hypothetical protein
MTPFVYDPDRTKDLFVQMLAPPVARRVDIESLNRPKQHKIGEARVVKQNTGLNVGQPLILDGYQTRYKLRIIRVSLMSPISI